MYFFPGDDFGCVFRGSREGDDSSLIIRAEHEVEIDGVQSCDDPGMGGRELADSFCCQAACWSGRVVVVDQEQAEEEGGSLSGEWGPGGGGREEARQEDGIQDGEKCKNGEEEAICGKEVQHMEAEQGDGECQCEKNQGENGRWVRGCASCFAVKHYGQEWGASEEEIEVGGMGGLQIVEDIMERECEVWIVIGNRTPEMIAGSECISEGCQVIESAQKEEGQHGDCETKNACGERGAE